MRFMDWFNVNDHTDVVSWKPFLASAFLTISSWAMEMIKVADTIGSVIIKLGQVATVVLALYIAANNAHSIYKKKQEDKRERERTGN
jgi:hypothetical protein